MTRSADIERLVRTGTRLRAKVLDLRYSEAPADVARVGVVVAKFGFTAVRRNQLKRRLRELVRLRMLPVLGPVDVLVRARREAYHATFETLDADLADAARRLSAGSLPANPAN